MEMEIEQQRLAHQQARMALNHTLAHTLTQPSPAILWQLRTELLTADVGEQAAVWLVLDRFYDFLTELSSKSTSRQYSHLASLLDIGAVGGVVMQNLLDGLAAGDIWQRLLTGGISESLMVMAARQYVKAWEGEMTAVYQKSAYFIYSQLWQLSAAQQPDMDTAERRHRLDTLIAPIRDDKVNGTAKAFLLGRLYQVLLLAHISQIYG